MFFAQQGDQTLDVARDLLGCEIEHDLGGSVRTGIVVETEAYIGTEDLASHAARGGRHGRARVMYGEPGTVYVYLVYGVHWCVNIVTEPAGFPAAVLIRAIETAEDSPRAGSGPGLVCRYMGIDGSANDSTFNKGPLSIRKALGGRGPIESGPRIGVSYAGEWAKRDWRFWLGDSDAVSTRPRRTRGSARTS